MGWFALSFKVITIALSIYKAQRAEDFKCPQCGNQCFGKGGFYCIDKPQIIKDHWGTVMNA